MADNMEMLPADLPENWEVGQTVAPFGEAAGLTEQHGFNYLNRQVNETQRVVNRHTGDEENPHGVTAAQVGALPLVGGTLTGNLILKNSANYGMKLNFGDGDNVHLYEYEDNKLQIKGSTVKISTTNLLKNGENIATVETDINPLKTSVANGKSQIASAISDKGVSTSATAEFSTMASNIRSIKTSPSGSLMYYIFFQGSTSGGTVYIDDGENGRPLRVCLNATVSAQSPSWDGLISHYWDKRYNINGGVSFEGYGTLHSGNVWNSAKYNIAFYDSPRRFQYDSRALYNANYILSWGY